WVDKTYDEKPPPLGMAIGHAGCEFDFNPPEAPPPDRPGRPPEKTREAIDFLAERLSAGDRAQRDLGREWEGLGKARGTIFNAFKAMERDGRLVIDGTRKPKVCHLVRNSTEGQESGS